MNPEDYVIAILDARNGSLIVRKITVAEKDKLHEQVENMPEWNKDCDWLHVGNWDIQI